MLSVKPDFELVYIVFSAEVKNDLCVHVLVIISLYNKTTVAF